MTKETYEKITRPLRGNPHRVRFLRSANKLLTIFVYCAYPALLLFVAVQKDMRFWRVLLTPAVSFLLVTIFRKLINAPRPYEALDIVPLIKKDTKGKSFPSRHIFSVFVIAMVFFYISLPLGILFTAIGLFLAVARVIGGVHFPKDVIAGAIIGILSGIIGIYLIP